MTTRRDADHSRLIGNDGDSDSGDAIDVAPTVNITARTSRCYDKVRYSSGSCSDRSAEYIECEEWVYEPWMRAGSLDPLYRYHIYFSHSPVDVAWVEETAIRLVNEPLNYRCHYTERRPSSSDPTNCLLQTILCAAILSEIIVIVLSPSYVAGSWFTFQRTLHQLTVSSLRKQRMLVIILEDCEVPSCLSHTTLLYANHPAFFRHLINALKSDRLPRSSVSVGGDILVTRNSVFNGNLLCTVTAKIEGRCNAALQFDCQDVPVALSCQGINMSCSEFSHIIHAVGNKNRAGRKLSWLFTWKPLIIISAFCFLWFIAFVLVIVLLLEAPTSSTLPIRLPVFVFPFVFVILAYFLRWKRRKKYTNLAMQMFNKCVEMNQSLYDEGKTLVLTSARTETDVFHIYFMYYNITDCVKSVEEYLRATPNADGRKMANLINLSTHETEILLPRSLAERLCIILAAPYAQRLLFGLNPRVDHNRRHVVGKNQCLCQFVCEFVADYLSRLDSQRLSVPDDMFANYVNLSLRKNSMKTVQELITSTSDEMSHISTASRTLHEF